MIVKVNSQRYASFPPSPARSLLCGLAAAFFVIGAGCRVTEYGLHLEPNDEGMERLLVVRDRVGDRYSSTSEETLQRLSAAYGVPGEQVDRSGVRFSGRFAERMPGDLHGAGRYVILNSPAGTAYGYVERFGGEPDLLKRIESTREASDTLARVVRGWFERELSEEDSWPVLASFIEDRLPRDLANLSLYWWIGEATSSAGKGQDAIEDLSARVFLYLVETGYLHPAEMPAWLHLLQNLGEDEASLSLQPVQRLIARVTGVPDDRPIPASLDFIARRNAARQSWEAYARTPAFAEALGRDLVEDPQEALEDLFHQWLGIDSGPGERVEVALRSGREPAWTNGKWDSAAEKVVWPDGRLPGGREMPSLAYAVWAEPDEDAQSEAFGGVVLDGEPLVNYVLWYRGLPFELRETWDEHLRSLDPGEPLGPQLEALSAMTPDDRGRELLIEAVHAAASGANSGG